MIIIIIHVPHVGVQGTKGSDFLKNILEKF